MSANIINRRKGFTLIELIVVLAVLAIISSIAVPKYINVQKKIKIDADYATGVMIAKAAELYYTQSESKDNINKGEADKKLDLCNITFQSENLKGCNIDDVFVKIEKDTEKIKVLVNNSDKSIQIYPENGELIN